MNMYDRVSAPLLFYKNLKTNIHNIFIPSFISLHMSRNAVININITR